MTALLNLLGFSILCVLIAYYVKERIIRILPIAMAVLLAILFCLACIRRLNWIDYIWIAEIFLSLFLIIYKKRSLDFEFLKSILTDPANIAISLTFAVLWLFLRFRIAYYADELGVWAIEPKTLYLINGFTGKFKHTTLDFGDYSPGQMLLEWWVCHMNPRTFDQGLMYVGYWCIVASFFAPIFSAVKKAKHILPMTLAGIFVIISFPSVFSQLEYCFLSIELLMGMAFGNMLFVIFDDTVHDIRFDFGIWSSLSFLLIAFKSTGMIFLILLSCFAISIQFIRAEESGDCFFSYHKITDRRNWIPRLLLSWILTAGWYGAWNFIVRRTARAGYFSPSRMKVQVNHELEAGTIVNDLFLYLQSMIKAVLSVPMHSKKSNLFDLTIFACMVLTVLGIFYFRRLGKLFLSRKEFFAVIAGYCAGLFIYSFIMLCTFTFVFRETEYMKPETMIFGLSRYMEPLFIGIPIVLLFCVFSEKIKWQELLFTIIFIALTMSPPYVSRIYTGISERPKWLREQLSDAAAAQKLFEQFKEKVNSAFAPAEQARIIYVTDEPDSKEFDFLRFEMVPRSIYVLNYDHDKKLYDAVSEAISTYHAEYVYFGDINDEYVISEMEIELMPSERLFKVLYDDDTIVLEIK